MGCGASSANPPSGPAANGADRTLKKEKAATKPSAADRRKTTTSRQPRRLAVSAEQAETNQDGTSDIAVVEKPQEVTDKLVVSLKAHPLFEHLALPLMQRCIGAMSDNTFQEGAIVIREGDAGDQFYIAFSGSFEAYHDSSSSKISGARSNSTSSVSSGGGSDTGTNPSISSANGEMLLQTFGSGDVFGELALLYNSPRACSVRATTDSVAYSLDRNAFRTLVMAHNSGLKHGLEKYLRTVPMLAELSDDETAALANVMDTNDVSDGEYICEVGDAADTLFLVLSGEVVCHRDGGDKELLRLHQGDFFGESCLNEDAADQKRLANVVAVGKVRLGVLKATDFKNVVGSLTSAMNRALNRKAIEGVDMLKV